MSGFVSIPLITYDNKDADVLVRTCINEADALKSARSGMFGSHQFLSTNKGLPSRCIVVKSAIIDAKIKYPDEDPPTGWSTTVVLAKREKNVPRSAWLSHLSECPPNNGHTVQITVEISSMYLEEKPPLGGTEVPFPLNFCC